MKKCLSYWKFWWSAKGRHGTHSPFVYAFVEQVMRSKKKIVHQLDNIAIPQQYSLQDIDYLYKILQYLPSRTVYVASADIDFFNQLLQLDKNNSQFTLEAYIAGITVVAPYSVVVTQGDDPFLNAANWATGITVLVCAPHHNYTTEKAWLQCWAQQKVSTSIDIWHWGLLTNDASFKRKQHFNIR
jgi:hypothetical protein